MKQTNAVKTDQTIAFADGARQVQILINKSPPATLFLERDVTQALSFARTRRPQGRPAAEEGEADPDPRSEVEQAFRRAEDE